MRRSARLGTGRALPSLLDADNFTSRYDTVMRTVGTDEGEGVPFQIEYLFRPDGRNGRPRYWLEDSGRWYAGADGRPAEAFGIVRRIDDRHSRDQHLSFLGNCDPLTGMMNRGRMAEALGEAIAACRARRQFRAPSSSPRINNLAVVNDAYGFEVADEVIIAVGRRLRQVVRTGDPIARYSGSKFGIILNNCGEEDLRHRRRALPRRGARERHRDRARPGLGHAVDRRRSSCPVMPPMPTPRWRAPKRR